MHRRTRHLLLALAAVAAAAFLIAGCGGSTSGSTSPSQAATTAPVKGGTLVATYQGEPQGLDPAIDWEGQGWAIEHTMFNTFIKYASKPGTAGTEMLPDLATEVPSQENGGIADGGKTYTFHLKEGIKFAPPVDREVTSADFKYSFERMMADPKAPATGFYIGVVGAQAFMDGKAKEIAGYTTPDKYTVVIKLEKPDMAFMGAMAMSFTDVVAREWVEKWGRQINRHPLGTGPFMFDHWTAGQRDRRHAQPQLLRAGDRLPRRDRLRVLAQPVHGAAQAPARRRQRARRLHPAGGVRARQERPGDQGPGRRGAGHRHRLPVPEPHREAVRRPQGAPGDQHGRRPHAHRQAPQRRRRPAHAAVSRPGCRATRTAPPASSTPTTRRRRSSCSPKPGSPTASRPPCTPTTSIPGRA